MKKGFTLAEVLITLAVIGVVATLTMPSLIGNYQNRVLMTQLQKTLNTVQNAALRYMEDTAAENFRDLTQSETSRNNFLKNYFDTVNICREETGFNNCLAQTYTSFDKSNSTSNNNVIGDLGSTGGTYCTALTSGATFCIGGDGWWPRNASEGGARKVLIDVNGIKPPNVNGKDLFRFYILKTGKLGYNINTDYSYENNMEIEARGDKCNASSASLSESNGACLPYIISHGWQFKF